jgi:hypothetical protein
MAKDKMWEPGMDIPQDEDGASATRTPKKREKIKYEEPGSAIKVEKMAKGGVTRADGCVSKGHTKGRVI